TVVLQTGVRLDDDEEEKRYRWSQRKVFSASDYQTPGKITFTFIPQEQLEVIFPELQRPCGERLRDGNIYINFIHYGPGFYERIATEPFDIMDTQIFGAVYFDTLAIPIDTTPVCPPDC
ncbi:MAG: hypothetical protein EA391_10140, partial [Balneolaceae bacterium]